MKTVRTRIAPSPTGFPHIGTIFQALFDYIYARQHNGQFIIRIEDTDQARFVKDTEEAIYGALEWIGTTPDEGPKYGGEHGPYKQSERLDLYQKYAKQLVDQGDAYYCFCSQDRLTKLRQDQQKSKLPPMYDKKCRSLDPKEALKRSKSEKYVVRLKIPKNEQINFIDAIRGEIVFESDTIDDQVILKSDGFPTYHLAVVVDDHLMGITHMVRGEEWISSTPKHVLIYRYLGWDMPVIIHTPLLRNPDRSKLSKRHGHAAVTWYQEQGYLKEAVINFLASRVWNHPEGKEIYPIEELTRHFKWEEMHIQGPIIDLDKLKWLNNQWIKSLTDEQLLDRSKPFLSKSANLEKVKQIIPLLKERLHQLSDIDSLTSYLSTAPKVDPRSLAKTSKMSPKETQDYLLQIIKVIESQESFTPESLETSLRELQQKLGIKPRPAFMTLRLALTGLDHTPPLFDVMVIIGKKESITRLESAIKALN